MTTRRHSRPSGWSAGSTSAEPDPPIASGRTAEVFADGPDRVLKVLRPGFPDEQGEAEAAAAQLADRADIGAPHFLGATRVRGRFALIYERRDGISMLDRLVARPWQARRLGATLGTLHADMHAASAATLPDLGDAIRHAIRGAMTHAGDRAVDRALHRLDRLPSGSSLCHGDFHPGNVMLTGPGPVIIDWLTAASGPPAADVARTLFLLRDGHVPPGISALRRASIGLLRRQFSSAYLGAYRRRRPLDIPEVAAWRLPILVARLDEDIVDERDHVVRLIDQELASPER